MIKANPTSPGPFSESVRLLRELHLLMVDGKGDSEAADQVRSAMEAPWRKLSAKERVRVEGLSADLYSIEEDQTPATAPADRGAAEFERAFASEDWDCALAILRGQQGASPGNVAAWRGIAWSKLGYDDIAALFFAEAFRLQPRNIDFKTNYLRTLVHAGRFGDAKKQALNEIGAATDAYEVLLSAEILFDCAQDGEGADDPQYREVIALISHGLTLLGEPPLEPRWAKRTCTAYLTMALCYDELGDRARAGELYEKARTVRTCLPKPIPALPCAIPNRNSFCRENKRIRTSNRLPQDFTTY